MPTELLKSKMLKAEWIISKKKITPRHLGIVSSTSFETEKKVYVGQLLC